MSMYNKRNMNFLEKEMEDGKHPYLKDALEFLNKAEEQLDEWTLNMAKFHLDNAIPELEPNDSAGWRKELLLNYLLNIELAFYKKKDSNHTKWTAFLEIIEDNGWKVIKDFVKKIDAYISSQREPNNIKTNLNEEKMNKIMEIYEKEVSKYIKEKLKPVDQYRAELRITQRLNLLKRKVPLNKNFDFGQFVKEKRTAKKWSLNTLAEKSGYSPAYIFRIEKGTRKNPTPQVVSRIVSALGYDPEDYLNILFESNIETSNTESIELSELIQTQKFNINGKLANSKQKKLLSEIISLINEGDVLLVPKINKLKEKIQEYQEETL